MTSKNLIGLIFLAVLANGSATASDKWDQLPDGSIVEFKGAGGFAIPAYVREPKGAGRFRPL